jgi:hypothetical protein
MNMDLAQFGRFAALARAHRAALWIWTSDLTALCLYGSARTYPMVDGLRFHVRTFPWLPERTVVFCSRLPRLFWR